MTNLEDMLEQLPEIMENAVNAVNYFTTQPPGLDYPLRRAILSDIPEMAVALKEAEKVLLENKLKKGQYITFSALLEGRDERIVEFKATIEMLNNTIRRRTDRIAELEKALQVEDILDPVAVEGESFIVVQSKMIVDPVVAGLKAFIQLKPEGCITPEKIEKAEKWIGDCTKWRLTD